MTIDTTPGSPTANSYASVAEADAYHNERLHSEEWAAASEADKEKALIWATQLLDSNMDWFGYAATQEQALRFPRYEAYDPDGYVYDSTIIPPPLKNATAEYGRLLLGTDIPTTSNADTFESIKVSSIELDYRDVSKQTNSMVPDSVYTMIDFLGVRQSVKTSGGSMSVTPLVRG